MEFKLVVLLLVVASVVAEKGETFISNFPSSGSHRTGRMSLGTQVGTAECAHIGRNCGMQRDKTDNPSSFTYIPCCQHLTCQGIGPAERRNALGQAHSSDDNTFTGICTVSLDNGGGDLESYKEYLKEL